MAIIGYRWYDVEADDRYHDNCQVCGPRNPGRKTAGALQAVTDTPGMPGGEFWLCVEHRNQLFAWLLRSLTHPRGIGKIFDQAEESV